LQNVGRYARTRRLMRAADTGLRAQPEPARVVTPPTAAIADIRSGWARTICLARSDRRAYGGRERLCWSDGLTLSPRAASGGAGWQADAPAPRWRRWAGTGRGVRVADLGAEPGKRLRVAGGDGSRGHARGRRGGHEEAPLRAQRLPCGTSAASAHSDAARHLSLTSPTRSRAGGAGCRAVRGLQTQLRNASKGRWAQVTWACRVMDIKR
jgi:hypothetical protein